MGLLRKIPNSRFWILDSKSGFTIMELIIFAAIFALTAISFITVLVSVTRVQVSQSSVAEVNQQSQFLLQTLQRYIERSSAVEMTADEATSTLKLRMSDTASDPTYIYTLANRVYIKETDGGTPAPLTSDRVNVSELSFTKRENPGGRDSVSLAFTVEYANENMYQKAAHNLRTSVTRVSAAVFDSDIVPPGGAGNTYRLGVSAQDWKSINNTIFFSGTNVGIGVTPAAKLQIASGDVYIDTVAKGVIQRSADGTCWRLSVSNAGALSAASTTCP